MTSYIEQGMNTTQIVDLIFDLHRDFINPKVIARRQVTRLIDRLLTRVAPELILNRQNEDKENASNNTAQQTPAKMLGNAPAPQATVAAPAELGGPSKQAAERQNPLALQLSSAAKQDSAAPLAGADGSPSLEQAP